MESVSLMASGASSASSAYSSMMITSAGMSEGFGLFLRAITGLSREAAVQAFSEFQRGRTLSPAEYAFVDLVIESLTQNGYLDVGELYEPPFKRVGVPDVIFRDPADVDVIINVLDHVKKTAVPVTDAEAC
jgi:type I restriction enzyme, R subunit